jgi:hypothetical protein
MSLFQLGREAEKGGLVERPRDELDADRQPRLARVQRQRHRRLSGDVDERGVRGEERLPREGQQRVAVSVLLVQPIGTGSIASVGVITMSYSSQNATTRRAIVCSCMIAAPYSGLGVSRACSASARLIGSSNERSSIPEVAGPTCQTRMNSTIISGIDQGGVASTTSWPSSLSRSAAPRTAATHSRSTGTSTGGVVATAMRNSPAGSSHSSRYGRCGTGAT